MSAQQVQWGYYVSPTSSVRFSCSIMMNETSLEAYWYGRTSKQFSKQAAQVLDSLNVDGPGTRAELSVRLGLRLSAICGRVRELIDLGILREFDKVMDPDTKKRVWKVRICEGV